jgi:hypothetical protein
MKNKSDVTSAVFHYHLSIAMYNDILIFHFLFPPLKLSIDLFFYSFYPLLLYPKRHHVSLFLFFNFFIPSPLDIMTINNIFHPFAIFSSHLVVSLFYGYILNYLYFI